MNAKLKNEVLEIKHMAFAVEDIEQSLKYYKKFMGVSNDIEIQDMPKSRTRVAVFNIGDSILFIQDDNSNVVGSTKHPLLISSHHTNDVLFEASQNNIIEYKSI